MKLTPQKQRILDTITKYIEEHGYSPTLREVAQVAHISTSTLHEHISQLEEWGYVYRKYNQGRSVVPVSSLHLQLSTAVRAYQTAFTKKHNLTLVRTDKHFTSDFVSKTTGIQYKIALSDMVYDIDEMVPTPVILRWAKSPSDESFQFYVRKYGKVLDT